MDLAAARAAPGVLAIVTARDRAGKLGKGRFNTAKLFGGPEVEHYHQAIAVVVAETFEQARAASHADPVDYVARAGPFDLAEALATAPLMGGDSARAARARRGPGRRLRAGLRRGAGHARRSLHARPTRATR